LQHRLGQNSSEDNILVYLFLGVLHRVALLTLEPQVRQWVTLKQATT